MNSDGKDDAIVVTSNNTVVAYTYSTTGEPVRVLQTYSQAGNSAAIRATPAVTNIPGVGLAIFAATVDGRVFGWNARTGALLSGWPTTGQDPGVVQPLADSANAVYGGIATGDLDADGIPEILVPSINHELTAYRANGKVFWRFNNDAAIVSVPVIGDLDQDGLMDVVLSGDSSASSFYELGGRITALSGDGRRKWVFQIDQAAQSSPTLADLNQDGFLDVVFGTGYNVAGTGNKVYALDRFGKLLPGWPYTTDSGSADAGTFPSPAVADLLNDGTLKVVIGDGLGRYHAINADGSQLWITTAVDPQRQYASPIVADINGDGILDVIAATGNTVQAFSGTNGALIWTQDNTAQVYFRSPAVGHFKGDGTWQLAIVADSPTGNLYYPSLLQIYDLGTSTVAPGWRMFRRDAAGANAIARGDIQLTAFIKEMYGLYLGRLPSDAEVAGWLTSLRQVPTLAGFIDSVLNSAEFRNNLISTWYSQYLGRAADAGGFSFWQSFLAAGNSVQTAQTFFVASDEAFQRAGGTADQWVNYLYQVLLNRFPSDAERTSWSSQLINGTKSRSDIAFGFFFSIEYTERSIVSLYVSVFNASPPADAVFAAAWDLRRGRSAAEVTRNVINTNGDYILASPEGKYIRTIYKDLLQRDPSPPETASWLSAISAGTSLNTIASAVVRSFEYRTVLVQSYYERYLGRTSTAAERTNWVNNLGAGMAREQIIKGFVQSAEFQNRAGNTLPGFINLAYQTILGRAATANDQSFWQSQPNPYTALPNTLLRSQEYLRNLVDEFYFTYLRRLGNTPPDGSAFYASGPYAEQARVNFLAAGGNPESIEIELLTSPEYQRLAITQARWTGKRWIL